MANLAEPVSNITTVTDDTLTIADKVYRSRLLVGSGKYRDLEETRLATEASGAEIITVEGLAQDGRLDPVQQALIDTGGVQCGFCTPGVLITARALLDRNPRPSEDEIREALVGNLCRCTGYVRIIQGIQEAARL